MGSSDAALDPTSRWFREVYEENFDHVARTLRRHRIREHDLEDLAQAVFIIVYRRQAICQTTKNRSGWIVQIAHNVARTHRRDWGRREAILDHHADPAAVPSPEGPADRQARLERVLECVAQIPDDQVRAVVVRHHLDETPLVAIAEEVGRPAPTLSSQLQKGYRIVRRLYARGEVQGQRRAKRTAVVMPLFGQRHLRQFAVPEGVQERVWRRLMHLAEPDGGGGGGGGHGRPAIPAPPPAAAAGPRVALMRFAAVALAVLGVLSWLGPDCGQRSLRTPVDAEPTTVTTWSLAPAPSVVQPAPSVVPSCTVGSSLAPRTSATASTHVLLNQAEEGIGEWRETLAIGAFIASPERSADDRRRIARFVRAHPHDPQAQRLRALEGRVP